jgi:transcriptional regulator with XRE-family HTH domain
MGTATVGAPVSAGRARRSKDAVVGSATLAILRERAGFTQGALATKLDVRQGNISKIEARGDMRLSTLEHYLEAIGAKLELRAIVGRDVFVIDIEETRGQKRPRHRPAVESQEGIYPPLEDL